MSELSKQALKVENNQSFPNNNAGLITPSNLRTFNEDMIDSTVNQATYTSDSASFDARILAVSASAGGDLTSLNQFTASQQSINSGYNSFTQSQQTENAINQAKWNTIGSQSGSWVTESETGSFARTNVTNTFTQNQIIQGNLSAYTMSADTLNVRVLNTTIESSSVIYSSGSNVLGDSSNDVQTLNGSVRVVNELTASGLNYPNADNGAKSFIQTDGNGNLSLQYVDTIWEAFYAGQSVAKGTPLYFSGSQGANPIAYAADASDVNKMPVVLIAGENLTAGSTYEGIVLGLIEGVDLTGYTAGQTVYVAEGGGWTTSLPSGSNSITQVLGIVTKGGNGGKGLVLNPGPAQLPGLQTGYTWVGNGNNRAIAVSTGSIIPNLSGYATTGSNTFTGNQVLDSSDLLLSGSSSAIKLYQGISTLRFYSGSNDSQVGTWINLQTNPANGALNISAFPQNNVFVDFNPFTSQSVFTSLVRLDNGFETYATSSLFGYLNVNGGISINTPINSNVTVAQQLFVTSANANFRDILMDDPGAVTSLLQNPAYFSEFKGNVIRWQENAKSSSVIFAEEEVETLSNGWGNTWDNALYTNVGRVGAEFSDWDFAYNRTPWLRIGRQERPQFLRGLQVTGSTQVQNFTASLQEGHVFVGNSNGITISTPTSSFAENTNLSSLNAFTASQEALNTTFATTGSNTFVGTQIVSSSISIDGATTASVITIKPNTFGNGINLFQDGASAIRFYSGSNTTDVGTWVNLQTNPANGALAISAFPLNNHFVDFNPFTSQSVFDSLARFDKGFETYNVTSSFYGYTNVNGGISINSIVGSNLRVAGQLYVTSSNANFKDISIDDPNATTSLRINNNFDGEFIGSRLNWYESTNKTEQIWAEENVELLLNGWGGTYDNALYLTAGNYGAEFSDWDGGYNRTPWLRVAPQGNPSFQRNVEVTGSVSISTVMTLKQQDPLPGGSVGQLAVSGSNLYFHNGTNWSQIN